MYDILELKSKLLPDLQDVAKNLNIPKYRTLKKMDLIYQILDVQARGYVDEVIEPAQTRIKLMKAFTMLENKVASLPKKKHGNIPL